jgi:hypothetical protein
MVPLPSGVSRRAVSPPAGDRTRRGRFEAKVLWPVVPRVPGTLWARWAWRVGAGGCWLPEGCGAVALLVVVLAGVPRWAAWGERPGPKTIRAKTIRAEMDRAGKRRGPGLARGWFSRGGAWGPFSFWVGVRRCPTLPRTRVRSTIGAGGLNCRVRYGSGCFPAAVTTVTLFSYVSHVVCVVCVPPCAPFCRSFFGFGGWGFVFWVLYSGRECFFPCGGVFVWCW